MKKPYMHDWDFVTFVVYTLLVGTAGAVFALGFM